jgi:hypothetical protein
MIVGRGWADSLALAEGLGLGRFVILHGVDRYRGEVWRAQRSVSESGARIGRPTVGWGLEHQSDHGEPSGAAADACAPRRCCACKRGRACADPGKHPRVIKDVQEHGHLDARPATELLEIIAGLRYRPINLGIVPAAGMIVLDVDPRNGGRDTLAALEARHGVLPPTLGVYTGGGGEHRWYRAPSAARRASIGAGLDIKTSGGLLVAPPSVHLTGKRYAWTNRQLPPTECPPWLDEASRTEQTHSGGAGRSGNGRPIEGAVLVTEMGKATVGDRAHSLFRLACWALDADADLGPLLDAARGVGLTEREIRRQVHGARRATRR